MRHRRRGHQIRVVVLSGFDTGSILPAALILRNVQRASSECERYFKAQKNPRGARRDYEARRNFRHAPRDHRLPLKVSTDSRYVDPFSA